jgi:uncharacterized phiE125 gp8 family phage protein
MTPDGGGFDAGFDVGFDVGRLPTWFRMTDVNPVPVPALRLITPPAPVATWAEASAHLRINNETERSLVESYIAAATQHLDAKYGILAGTTLGVQTWELYLDAFPCGAIKIPLVPLVGVVSVAYFDPAGTAGVVDPANYVIDTKSYDGWVVPIAGYSWPATLQAINIVTVRFTAGTATVPAPIKLSILLLAGHFYEHREAVSATTLIEIPMAVDRLVAPYRRIYV